jgi:ankyrin repeat protein
MSVPSIHSRYLLAAAKGQLEEMRQCLEEEEASPYIQDTEGKILKEVAEDNPRTPFFCRPSNFNALHFSCHERQDLVSGELLEKYPNLTNQPDSKGLTPLFYFLNQSQISPEIFEAFVSSETKFDHQDQFGWTPLHTLAARPNHFVYLEQVVLGTVKKVQTALLKWLPVKPLGALVTSYLHLAPGMSPESLNLQTLTGIGKQTPLDLAIQYRNHEAVDILRLQTDLTLKNSLGITLEENLKDYDRSRKSDGPQIENLDESNELLQKNSCCAIQ